MPVVSYDPDCSEILPLLEELRELAESTSVGLLANVINNPDCLSNLVTIERNSSSAVGADSRHVVYKPTNRLRELISTLKTVNGLRQSDS